MVFSEGARGTPFASNEFYSRVTKDLARAYTFFLLDHRVIDAPMVKVAFYAACEKMLLDDPLPFDPIMQAAILQHIRDIIDETAGTYLERVQQVLLDVALNELGS